VGAVLSFYWKESLKTLKDVRKEEEKKLADAGKPIPYPSFEAMRAEDNEEKPYLLINITDEAGNAVRRLKADASAGLKRIVWDFRYAPTSPVSLQEADLSNPFSGADLGYWALPGKYKATLHKVVNGIPSEALQSQEFNIKLLNNATLAAPDRKEVVAFQAKVSELRRVMYAANSVRQGMEERIKYLKGAVLHTPKASPALLGDLRKLEERLQAVKIAMNGDASVARREFETAPSIMGRVELIVYGLWSSTTAPTTTQINNYEAAAKLFEPVLQEIKQLSEVELRNIEKQLETQGAPWTPGRILNWNRE
jgi:hypothetical protein